MIFLTVGSQFPFDRLVKAVDKAVETVGITEQIFAQIGKSSYQPRNFDSATLMDKDLYDDYIDQASSIISHAGIGTITIALSNDKPLLVMPRLKKYGEVVNDHQVAIAIRFAKLKHILTACDQDDLPEKIKLLKTFVPRKRNSQAESVSRVIAQFLNEISV